jgi:hydroxymethylglutaryl-CoA lyase
MEHKAIVREMGLRDGLQSIRTIMPTATKIEWARREAEAGVSEIEVASFVPPKLLPQMADAGDVVAAARAIPGLKVAALVPNLKGAERAVAAGAQKLNFVMSVSESHNQANVRRAVAESLADFGRIVEFARALPAPQRPVVCAGLATAFGCTIEGAVSEDRVRALALEAAALGAEEMVIADTVGYGNPAAVRRVFGAVRNELPDMPLGAHFHDTRGVGLANVVAALDAGIIRFDASLGGLGGCPYAPGASGNIVMEASLEGEQFHGALSRAGLPKNYAHA